MQKPCTECAGKRRQDEAKQNIRLVYNLLIAHYGPTNWWPGETPFEIAIGAILTQNTAWTNVERAISNLNSGGLLTPHAILEAPDDTLFAALRPSGYFRIKAQRARAFCAYLLEQYGGDMGAMRKTPTDELREELLAINGIGPETADDILLYACERPVFVVDAYTRRILSRHGLCEPNANYAKLQAFFEDNLDRDLVVFKEYHGLIVYVGKDFCRKTPKCATCPLADLLEPDQPWHVDSGNERSRQAS